METSGLRDEGWLDVNGAPFTSGATITERFRRPNYGRMEIDVTIDDPNVFTKPWKVSFPMSKEPSAQVFEYACQEGNYAMTNILSGARAVEKISEEGTKR